MDRQEDTFDRLRRIPVNHMLEIYEGWVVNQSTQNSLHALDRYILFKNHGWTWIEFCREMKWNRDNPPYGY